MLQQLGYAQCIRLGAVKMAEEIAMGRVTVHIVVCEMVQNHIGRPAKRIIAIK